MSFLGLQKKIKNKQANWKNVKNHLNTNDSLSHAFPRLYEQS